MPGEPHQEAAVKLKEDFVYGMVELHAPTFIVEEVANALWKAVKLDRISEKDAEEALEALGDIKIELHETSWAQASRELDVACRLDCTAYDASYLLLADKIKTSLITADEKLYEKAKQHFKIVYIKDYS